MKSESTTKKMLFLGYGYVAQHIKPLLDGFGLSATCQSSNKMEVLSEDGFDAFHLNTEYDDFPEHMWSGVTHMLISIPPDINGDIMLKNIVLPSVHAVEWIGLLSSTGVYGDYGGEWVDENSPPINPDARQLSRIKQENDWREFCELHELPLTIFRLAGIYGPGRSALDDMKNGKARRIFKPSQYFSRVHVEDIAAIVNASIKSGQGGSIFNLADDLPAPSHEVIEYAAGLLGMEPPEMQHYEHAELSAMSRSFYSSNRRVRNTKIKAKLGISLKYPTYKDGLQAIMNNWNKTCR